MTIQFIKIFKNEHPPPPHQNEVYYTVRTLKIKKTHIHLYVSNPERKNTVKIGQQTFTSISELSKAHPSFSTGQHLDQTAIIFNFLFTGISYHFIDDIKQYRKEIKKNRKNEPYPIDTRRIQAPRIENGQLKFCVYDCCSREPLEVTCTYPIQTKDEEKSFKYDHLRS